MWNVCVVVFVPLIIVCVVVFVSLIIVCAVVFVPLILVCKCKKRKSSFVCYS